jgi:hypothetical protein
MVAFGLVVIAACSDTTSAIQPGGGGCSKDLDCGAGYLCGFKTADGCGTAGQCFPASSGVQCALYEPGCACDGTTINIDCNGLPPGYASKPVPAPARTPMPAAVTRAAGAA